MSRQLAVGSCSWEEEDLTPRPHRQSAEGAEKKNLHREDRRVLYPPTEKHSQESWREKREMGRLRYIDYI